MLSPSATSVVGAQAPNGANALAHDVSHENEVFGIFFNVCVCNYFGMACSRVETVLLRLIELNGKTLLRTSVWKESG